MKKIFCVLFILFSFIGNVFAETSCPEKNAVIEAAKKRQKDFAKTFKKVKEDFTLSPDKIREKTSGCFDIIQKMGAVADLGSIRPNLSSISICNKINAAIENKISQEMEKLSNENISFRYKGKFYVKPKILEDMTKSLTDKIK